MTTLNLPRPRSHRAVSEVTIGPVRIMLAIGAVLAIAALIYWDDELRHMEACTSAWLARRNGLTDATCTGSTVLFMIGEFQSGVTITLGCTVTFLAIPFLLATSGLFVINRVSLVKSFLALLAAVAFIMVCNHLRLLSIEVAMRIWGAEDGYSATHILVGTLISTLGVIGGGLAYLYVLLFGDKPQGARNDG
ncbi:hypothetical protein [Catenuloplanes indicus]|uniref:Exosortase/archaeosortase n=1 Tax=Catenuloplanes indicus TaxID=137267 RepID=A0AAE4AXT3_9ACTN|nr:hypothetical protein [Catenuloplanes indicus]MDQ0366061.1 exosortase/archaeosortase [Catenuloplanes indicus]